MIMFKRGHFFDFPLNLILRGENRSIDDGTWIVGKEMIIFLTLDDCYSNLSMRI